MLAARLEEPHEDQREFIQDPHTERATSCEQTGQMPFLYVAAYSVNHDRYLR